MNSTNYGLWRFGNWICSRLQAQGLRANYSDAPLEKCWSPFHLKTGTDQFSKRFVLNIKLRTQTKNRVNASVMYKLTVPFRKQTLWSCSSRHSLHSLVTISLFHSGTISQTPSVYVHPITCISQVTTRYSKFDKNFHWRFKLDISTQHAGNPSSNSPRKAFLVLDAVLLHTAVFAATGVVLIGSATRNTKEANGDPTL